MTLIGTGQISSRFSSELRFIPGGLCFNALVPPGNAEQRKLAAIMFTDMVGYSALAQRDSLDNVKGDPRWDAFVRRWVSPTIS